MESALNQIVQFDKIIIIDDASTDNSAGFLTEFTQLANGKFKIL
ncbi:MAG: glycosyltransferase [Nostoc sp.]